MSQITQILLAAGEQLSHKIFICEIREICVTKNSSV